MEVTVQVEESTFEHLHRKLAIWLARYFGEPVTQLAPLAKQALQDYVATYGVLGLARLQFNYEASWMALRDLAFCHWEKGENPRKAGNRHVQFDGNQEHGTGKR